jgi:Fanconi anemia group M protein
MTKNTRDEGYRWSAHHKEKKMYRNLEGLKSKLAFKNKADKVTLQSFAPDVAKIKIFADHRERASGIIKELIDLNADIKLEQLDSADYILSSRCGVEFKVVEDFVNSIVDGRLLEQLKSLRNNFERPIVIIEGQEDIYSVRNIHPNAIRGMLATIAVSYGIPLLFTKNAKETAQILFTIAKREQEETSSNFSMHADRKPLSLKEQQEYFMSALPNIGLNLAKELLKEFKSVKNVVNASEEELKKVEKIGDIKAKKIKEVVEGEYMN